MKKRLTLLPAFLFFVGQAVAQNQYRNTTLLHTISTDSVLTYLRNKADSFLQTYKCCDVSNNSQACQDCPAFLITQNSKANPLQAILPRALDTYFAPVFNTVILNNDNSINAGSAGAIVQDNNGGALIANYAYQRKPLQYFRFFNIGVAAETNGNVLDLYSASAWRSGLLVTLGLTHFGTKKQAYFDAVECEKSFQKRRLFLNSLLAQYAAKIRTSAERENRIQEIKSQLGISDSSYSLVSVDQLGLITGNPQQAVQLQLELDSLTAVQQQLEYLSKYAARRTSYDSVLQNDLIHFDQKNMPAFLGYRTWWYNIKASIGNTRNKLFNDTLSTDNLPTYHLSDYTRLKLSWDGNWLWNKKNTWWLLKGEVNLFNRNFLQNKELSDLPYIEKDATGKRYVYSADNPSNHGRLGSLNNLNTSIWVLYPSLYTASFFAHNKCVGLEASAGYKLNLTKLQDVPDPNTYTVYWGLIFRVKKEEQVSKATVSVNVGFYEAKKGRRAPDDFALRLKVAVPFNTSPKKV